MVGAGNRHAGSENAEEPAGALDLLADGLHAGQTLEQGAELVAARTPAPLNEEFGYSVSLLKLGHSPVAVMERMARRIPLPEFQVFAMAVLVHRQTGGNLATLTSRLAGSARDRQEFFGHLGAQTVAGRYSAIGLVIVAIWGWPPSCICVRSTLEFFLQHELGPGMLLLSGPASGWGLLDLARDRREVLIPFSFPRPRSKKQKRRL